MSDAAKELAARLAAGKAATPADGTEKDVIAQLTALLIEEVSKVSTAPVIRSAIYKIREAEILVNRAIEAKRGQ